MAGLCGVIALADGVDVIALDRAIAARLAHRGPDGHRQWSGQGAAMSHLALHVHPSQIMSAQPLRLTDGRICIIDGCVAEPAAVSAALGWPQDGSALSDVQLIALAFERWGTDFWRHVEGDFALAVWNPASRELALMRDRLGVRPLFHVLTREIFAFASEPEALFHLPGVDGRVRDTSVAEVWTQLSIPAPSWSRTHGFVSVVPPAHVVRLQTNASLELAQYWQLQPVEPLHLADERAYVDAFQQVFATAVARATRGVSSTALMLSGGIDSGAILAASRGFKPGRASDGLLCISAVSDPAANDPGTRAESGIIHALTSGEPRVVQFQVPVGTRDPDIVHPADGAEVAWSYLHPVDASLYIPSLVCRIARREGCPVVLHGVDGDTVTASPLYYVGQLARSGMWRSAFSEAAQSANTHTYLKHKSTSAILWRSLLAESQPRFLRRLRARRGIERELEQIRASGLTSDFIEQASIPEKYSRQLASRLTALDASIEQQRCKAMAHWLDVALGSFNRMASRQGVEARSPWADLQVVQFFLGLPLQWRVRNGWTKYLVRKSCEAALGLDQVWHSGKKHHGPLVTRQLVIEAAPYLRTFLMDRWHLLQPYLQRSSLDAVLSLLSAPHELSYAEADKVNELVAFTGWIERSAGHNIHKCENSLT